MPEKLQQPDSRGLVEILHLSDLHFGTKDDAYNWYGQLSDDLKHELGCKRLDGLVLSGDVSQCAAQSEYKAAVAFVTSLCEEFMLDPERIAVVPGNHDLNWKVSKQGYDRGNRGDFETTDESERGRWIVDGIDFWVRDERSYRNRFDLFSKEFYEKVKGVPYPKDYAEQFIIHHWYDLGLLVVGFNSAWEIDHHYLTRAGIHPRAVSGALAALRATPDQEHYLKLVVWHHPLVSNEESRITDHGFLERLAQAGFRFAMHGHIHKSETYQYCYDLSPEGRRVDIIAAGTFGAPKRDWTPGYPLQYNLLRFEGDKLTVETRRREATNGAWKPDARWLQGPGKDPLPRYIKTLHQENQLGSPWKQHLHGLRNRKEVVSKTYDSIITRASRDRDFERRLEAGGYSSWPQAIIQTADDAKLQQAIAAIMLEKDIVQVLNGMRFRLIPRGVMADVTNELAFYMSERPLSEADWKLMMGGPENRKDRAKTDLSLDDALNYIESICCQRGLNVRMRLPRCSECKFVARLIKLGEAVHYSSNAGLGAGQANAFGIENLVGMVWQPCIDDEPGSYGWYGGSHKIDRYDFQRGIPCIRCISTGLKGPECGLRLVFSLDD